jgi:hypothetical protein
MLCEAFVLFTDSAGAGAGLVLDALLSELCTPPNSVRAG